MSFRKEEKLYIKKENLIDFKKFIYKKNINKIYEKRKIETIYLENLNLDSYKDSIEGLLPRKKLRIRQYPNNSDRNYYLETKISSVEGRFKKRIIVDQNTINSIINYGFFDNQYGSCYPLIKISYLRDYYLYNDVRVTIDDEIIYTNFKTSYQQSDKRIIIELKTNADKNTDLLFEDFPFQRIRFSKYCNAIEKLNFFN